VRPSNLSDYVFGNIFKQSIEGIWTSERAHFYRQQIPKACFECMELSRCRGGEKRFQGGERFAKDPLMKDPIREAGEETFMFDPEMRPVPCFRVREEPFGYLLCRYNWPVPVSCEAKPVLDAINGKNPLAQLQKQFGDEALDFVGHLYRERCVGFE